VIDLKTAGWAVSASAGAIAWVYGNFTPKDSYNRHVAEERTAAVQRLIETLQGEPAGDYRDTLCRTLEATLAQICLDSPEHPFCIDRTVLMAKAGC
jgi:hypothetical protein